MTKPFRDRLRAALEKVAAQEPPLKTTAVRDLAAKRAAQRLRRLPLSAPQPVPATLPGLDSLPAALKQPSWRTATGTFRWSNARPRSATSSPSSLACSPATWSTTVDGGTLRLVRLEDGAVTLQSIGGSTLLVRPVAWFSEIATSVKDLPESKVMGTRFGRMASNRPRLAVTALSERLRVNGFTGG